VGRFNKLIGAFGNIPSILEGIKNRIFTKEDVEEIAKIRGNICEQCSKFDMIGHSCAVPGTAPCCSSCGCILNLKVRSMSASCPDGKWAAFISKEDEDKFKDSLE
tara:strand:+ start:162 stop:476 length:315 start_codon:yes stop_codon:yes gene_type:complete